MKFAFTSGTLGLARGFILIHVGNYFLWPYFFFKQKKGYLLPFAFYCVQTRFIASLQSHHQLIANLKFSIFISMRRRDESRLYKRRDEMNHVFTIYPIKKTTNPLAPCAPKTKDCSISAVFEGPAIKVPKPYS